MRVTQTIRGRSNLRPMTLHSPVTHPVTVRLRGLSVYAHHGIVEEERTLGQRFEFDLDLEFADCAACRTDNVDDCIEYEQIAAVVVEVATHFRFQVMEALAEAVCLELLTEFAIDRVMITVSKTSPMIEQPIQSAGITLVRNRSHLIDS